jgi:hypothetical protein
MTDGHLKAFSEAMDHIFDAFDRTKRKPVTARQMDVVWVAPGANWKLRVDVDFDEHRVPHINEVTDISGQPIPLEAIWFDHKPLLDVLIEWLCETPADELERV